MADPTISIGVTVTEAGAQPTPFLTIWANLITTVAAINPGYSVLPAGLIEDLASTATLGIALIDSAAVETINSLTPFGANPYILQELGNIYGVQPGQGSNTSVFVIFSGTVGFQLPPGFTVSDGTHQYTLQEGTVVGADGNSVPAFCLATLAGSWAVPANSVTTLISSVPSGVTLNVNNPQAGIPSIGPQTQEEYAAQVLAAGLVASQGTASILKKLLGQIAGVQPRLISVQLDPDTGWIVICGGGDPYAVANAIYQSGIDLSTLVGSTVAITGITNAALGVVTTNINHGLTDGQNNVHIDGVVGMAGVNGGPYTVDVLTEKTFTFGINTTGSGTYVSGGVVTPNSRNITVDINDYPDSYPVTFTNPPAQQTQIQLSWDTISPNFVSDTAVSQLGNTAILNYVNSIPVGQPINLFAMEAAFIVGVISLFGGDASLISLLSWTVSINGMVTTPSGSTALIFGDPYSFFESVSTDITITQV